MGTKTTTNHASSSPLMSSLFTLLSVNLLTYILSYLSLATRALAARWRRFKDALFYEMMLLLLQPNPVVLLLMWPGWVAVAAVWLWWWWAWGAAGAAVVGA